jgi:hypothetical protein
LVSPVTAIVKVVPLDVVADALPGDAVTVYDVIAAPPLEVGAVQLTVACESPATAETLVAGPGTVLPPELLVVADAGLTHSGAIVAMNRETKPTKARETTHRFGIAEPSIGILLKVSLCKILLFTYSQKESRVN